ncbi:hypothetical protein C8A00DRAFT_17935 [Chaetomidium leptoderma]|uniref:Mucin n=1 Tax=Chaetomidium leptoderma TaxID=669021 RepID=A0AAN6VFJ6_9PEZI|nr:hypothetical protein C8A00DRAFT_17935 [Chaetomidium leptoderma]
MGSSQGRRQGILAIARGPDAVPERDSAISGRTSPGAHNRVMGAFDAHDSGGGGAMLGEGLVREADAGVASSSAHPRDPFDPFDPGGSSLQLPFLISNSSCSNTHPRDSFSWISSDQQDACHTPNPNLASHADYPPLFVYTFYLSPLTSGSSGAFSSRHSRHNGHSDESHEARSTMPGPVFDEPAEHRFPAPSSTTDYVSSVCAPAETRIDDTTQLRPHSADSGRSGRTASPLSFARWARRHQHHPHDRHHEEEVPKVKGRDRGSAERKTITKSSPKRSCRSRSSSTQKRQPQAAAVQQMTRAEFEALPLAIQRKYFSTLERLRFAQESGLVDGISQHYDDISNFKCRKPRQDRSASEQLGGQNHHESAFDFHSPTSDSAPLCDDSPEITQEPGFCRENQLRRRASVILDAADEAVYRLSQQACRKNLLTPVEVLTPPLSPARNSMDSSDGFRKYLERSGDGHVPQSFFDSFRWLDEEDDLDLRLFLDDYHANLREGTPTTKQRPSFRRHMSISKVPFGRRSSISTRPGTRGAMTPTSPIHSPTGSVSNGATHTRRKSRALSLITPKHAPQPSITAFDPAAAHYQDPEARLKLRVYLASPQKFDEAVEFGFPSADALSAVPAVGGGATGLSRRQARQILADDSSNMRTFLADDDEDDDNLSLSSDQPSLADPDSPQTPEPFEPRVNVPRHTRLASAGVVSGRKTPEGMFYAQAPASSREMTLRMTLTRPDLRAHEDDMYGWQQKQASQQNSRRPTMQLTSESRAAYLGNDMHRDDSLEKFPEVDHWNEPVAEKGVMRRIWNRVRRA